MAPLIPILITVFASPAPALSPIPPKTRQLVIVTTDDWTSTTGTLRRYSLDHHHWHQLGPSIPVTVGKSGLGWGLGVHSSSTNQFPSIQTDPIKQEGDGRAPAGIFSLTESTGYSKAPPQGTTLPYQQATPSLRCVDDPKSPHYNQLATAPENHPTPWQSDEHMLRPDAMYTYTIIVDHNRPRPKAGAGSCIFIHAWAAPDVPTIGCTAMAEPHLESLLSWLNAAKNPLLIQLPQRTYKAVQKRWALPVLRSP